MVNVELALSLRGEPKHLPIVADSSRYVDLGFAQGLGLGVWGTFVFDPNTRKYEGIARLPCPSSSGRTCRTTSHTLDRSDIWNTSSKRVSRLGTTAEPCDAPQIGDPTRRAALAVRTASHGESR